MSLVGTHREEQKLTKWHALDEPRNDATVVSDRLTVARNNKSYSLTDSSIVHIFNERFVLSKCVLVASVRCDFGLVCGFPGGEIAPIHSMRLAIKWRIFSC